LAERVYIGCWKVIIDARQRAEPVQGFLARARTRDRFNTLDKSRFQNEKPDGAARPASSIFSSKLQPRDPS
jgi:hypothetical protein